jgi:hypothetical protein
MGGGRKLPPGPRPPEEPAAKLHTFTPVPGGQTAADFSSLTRDIARWVMTRRGVTAWFGVVAAAAVS